MSDEESGSTSGATPLAAKMAKARVERGVTQGQLAERFHIRQSMLSMIETGEENESPELAGRMRAWIDSGAGAQKKSPRGPRGNYERKTRTTIAGR